MLTKPLPIRKKIGRTLEAGCRSLCRPFLPLLPSSLLNRLPFLGRVCVRGPGDLCVRFHTYGPYGKDRIAVKLGRRGLWGYEGETLRVFLPLVQDAAVVIDIGAHTGLFALLAAKANPHCQVWAFEPVPFIFEMLQNNLHLNRLTNLHAIPIAVSDCSGETPFFVTHTSVGIPTDSSCCPGFRNQVEELRLPTIRLDDYLDQHPIAQLDVLKIDAEASECKVIRGAFRTIEQHRPYVICEVLEKVDHSYLQTSFDSWGYRFFHIHPDHLQRNANLQGSLEVDQRNYLFVPAEKLPLLAEVCHRGAIPLLDLDGSRIISSHV